MLTLFLVFSNSFSARFEWNSKASINSTINSKTSINSTIKKKFSPYYIFIHDYYDISKKRWQIERQCFKIIPIIFNLRGRTPDMLSTLTPSFLVIYVILNLDSKSKTLKSADYSIWNTIRIIILNSSCCILKKLVKIHLFFKKFRDFSYFSKRFLHSKFYLFNWCLKK